MAFTHVLVPTDFSEVAQHALHYALEEATLHHAKVTLLHVLPVHIGTDVYFITGFPSTQLHFEPVLGERLSTPTPPQPTVVLYDHNEEALANSATSCPTPSMGTGK